MDVANPVDVTNPMDIVNTLVNLGVDKILWGLTTLFIALLITKLILKLFNKAITHIPTIDPALHAMLKTTLQFLLYFLSIMLAANIIGIPITSFVALFSVVGLAISLAVQGVLSNLAGGIIILASRMFTLNDFIEADSISGTVQEIGFLHTKLLSPDGKVIYVPNSLLHSARLINYTINGKRRVDLPISASYDNTPEEVRAAIFSAINTFPNIANDPAPEVILDSYGDNAINYIIRFWTSTADFWPVRNALNEKLYAAFKQHNVEMTYPHVNVHMK